MPSRSPLGDAIVALILAAGFLGYAAKAPPRPVPATAPDSVFSAERAMVHVREMARQPHPPGTAEHARVRDYVRSRLEAAGLTAEIQRTTAVGTRFQEAGRIENVVARLPGRTPGGPAIMLVAHYDGVGAGPAAGDDASGSSVLLESLRALQAGAPLDHDVIFLFTDGEEAGLLGAAAFVAEHRWAKDVALVINFEARGTGGAATMFQTGPDNLDQLRILRHAPEVAASSVAVTVYQFLPNDTDLSELFQLGTPALNFAFADGVERYHTSEDDAEHLDPGSIQQEGAAALAVVRTVGHGALPRPATGNAVFFTLPLVGLVVYPEGWTRPLAVVAVVLTLVAIVAVRRRERRWIRGIILGLLALVVATGAGGLAAWAAGRGVPDAVAAPGVRGRYAIGIALLGLGAALLAWAIVRRWVTSAAAVLGPLVLWTGLAVAASWRLPGVSFLLLWPAVFAAVAAIAHGLAQPVATVFLGRWL
ncbi:MAG: M28 family peptidase, partial [Gemmatimonadales bacterium]